MTTCGQLTDTCNFNMTARIATIALEICYLMTLLGYLSDSNWLAASTGSLSGLAANAFAVLQRCNVGCVDSALQVAQEARDSRHFRSQLSFGNAVDTHEIWHGIWPVQGCHLTQLLWHMHLYNTLSPFAVPSLPPISFVAFEWTFSIFDFEFGVACETFLRLGCESIKNSKTKTNA